VALSAIEAVRLRIGLFNTDNPFYSLISDDQIQYWIDYYDGNLDYAAWKCAICVSLALSSIPTRERIGEVEVWNDISKLYAKALQDMIGANPFTSIPVGLMPYAAGISWEDICANISDPDVVQSVLLRVREPISTVGYCADEISTGY